MTPLQQTIDDTYGSSQLARRLIASLATAGLDTGQLTIQDLYVFDELHVMGRQATLGLGTLARLTDEMLVLDIGCGLGGPARTLAGHFGCRVTGIDLSAEFVDAAGELSRCVGLQGQVGFRHGDALNLPFDDQGFDAAFMIHLNMNIEDKGALFREARRVLKPGGCLLLWEICAVEGRSLEFPVPWAQSPAFSFLEPLPKLVAQLRAAGFKDLDQEDATAEATDWVRARVAAAQSKRRRRPGPDLDLILKDFRLKRANISKNLMKGNIRILRASAVKP